MKTDRSLSERQLLRMGEQLLRDADAGRGVDIADFAAVAKAIWFEKQIISIRTPSGKQRVTAKVYGDIGVNRARPAGTFNLTHVPSGYAIISVEGENLAILVATEIVKLARERRVNLGSAELTPEDTRKFFLIVKRYVDRLMGEKHKVCAPRAAKL
jgi:hypothetical protein